MKKHSLTQRVINALMGKPKAHKPGTIASCNRKQRRINEAMKFRAAAAPNRRKHEKRGR